MPFYLQVGEFDINLKRKVNLLNLKSNFNLVINRFNFSKLKMLNETSVKKKL